MTKPIRKRCTRKFYLFERCSGGILNPKFDSEILEAFYSKCSFPRNTDRFRFGSGFMMFECICWLLFFCILRQPSWHFYLACFLFCIGFSAISFGLSFITEFFRRHCFWISFIYASTCTYGTLLPFVLQIQSVSLAFNLSTSLLSIILVYTMIHLSLWHVLLICGPLSVFQILLASMRHGFIGGANVGTHIAAHFCVHMIGIVVHLMSQALRRSTFLRLGFNALMRKELKKEQEIRDDMIHSLMPSDVAQQVMKHVGSDMNNTENAADVPDSDTPKNTSAKKKRSNNNKNKKSKKNNSRFDKMKRELYAFTDVLEDDCFFDEDEEDDAGDGGDTPLKKMSVPAMDDAVDENAGTNDNDVEDGTGSPRGSLVPKPAIVQPPRAVAFRKFHVNQLENVSVLFADIVGFTKMSSNKSASLLVYLLNDLFGRFDRLCEITECEKIATLGDCYYCVVGCPNPVDNHAERAVEMGRAMCLAIQQFDEDHNEEVNMRVGVHTGKVLCGLVGTRRFKFDVWSNDVSLANEMESSGQAGKVHISETTFSFVNDMYEVSEGEAVPDIRKCKVLVEFFNKEEQCFAIKHTQDEATIKTYFIESRFDGKPVHSLPPAEETKRMSISDPTQPTATTTLPSNDSDQPNGDGLISPILSTTIEDLGLIEEGKQPKLPPLSRSSDTEMLEALQVLIETVEVFAFPPISPITLNFRSTEVEAYYRLLGLGHPKSNSKRPLTWSTPRISPIINGMVQLICFLCILVACFVAFPDSRMTIFSGAYYTISVLAVLINGLFMALLFSDLAIWGFPKCTRKSPKGRSPKWPQFVIRVYLLCFRWPVRNVIGALLLFLPSALVFACFNIPFFMDLEATPHAFVAYYRLSIGLLFTFMLFNFFLFSSFSFWTKFSSALLASIITILLLFVPQNTDTSVIPNFLQHSSIYMHNQALLSTPLMWMLPVRESTFVWEILTILLITLVFVATLARELDISSRLCFHREFQALEAKQEIGQQKLQADWLLENIIPYYIMDDLRRTQKYSRHIVDAAVVFATLSNFSEFYDEQYQGGQEMLRVLNEIFADFEHLLALTKYKDVEKIKTIGSCFMAASGLNMIERAHNKQEDEHLWALVDFSVDLIHTLDDFNRQMFNFQFEMKVGYNIGEVTAGVIGTTKLLYDIWGDTVNVASRMYSTGQKGRIQVTEAVAKRLEPRFEFTYRGEVFVKGKGDMKTYLLIKRRSN